MALEGCDTPECLQARSFPRTTIPPVARARREMLTTTAAAGRAPRFVQRTTPLQGATCSQTLGCGLLGHPQAPLEALPHTAAAVGIEIRPHALEQRLTAAAAACLPQGRLAALARGITAAPGAMPLLERLTAVSGPESATSIVPALFAAPWPGGGGSTAARARAALQLQARWEMWTGRLDGPRQEGRASERAAVLPGPLPAGAVRLAAVGSWSLEAVAALEPPQVCWRSRLQRQTAVDEATGERRARRDRWESQALAMGALAVALGERQRLAARLLAVRVPPDGAATRRRRLRAAARDQGRQVRATRRAVAAGTLGVTQGPAARLTGREALGRGRLRWQRARLCTWWTSQGRVDESRSTTPWRLLGAVSATLLAMFLQPGVVLVRLWASPDRSVTQAAPTVQPQARPLASAFPCVQRLGQALLTGKRGLAAGCRMPRRQKPPNTSQRLLQATGP